MTPEEHLQTVRAALAAGIVLSTCQKCGCMEGTLKHLAALLPRAGTEEAVGLAVSISASLRNMRPVQYACLGCAYCYPAVAQNAFAQAFPALGDATDVQCAFRVRDAGWPPVVGEYVVLDKDRTVAVSTLASITLAEELAHPEPDCFLVGMKSYGRAPTFLLTTGYEQVRSVVAALVGDQEATARVELHFPATGLCRAAPGEFPPSGCGAQWSAEHVGTTACDA